MARTTSPLPNVTLARRRFSRGDLKQACEAAFEAARLTDARAFVGSNYGGYYVAALEREARGTSNVWYEVTPDGRVGRVEDHPEREILARFG